MLETSEGDSRILMQKLTRDRLQVWLEMMSTRACKAFAKSPGGQGKEAEALHLSALAPFLSS